MGNQTQPSAETEPAVVKYQVPKDGRMDPELKSKWVAALRSGKFKQGRQWFELDGKFCCLGVLCSVAKVDVVDSDGMGNWTFVNAQLKDAGFASDPAMHLARLNDEGMSFRKIASYIEANL